MAMRFAVLLAVVFTLSTFFQPYPLSWLVKILPMAILIYCYRARLKGKVDEFFLLGLICSAIGDFFLDFSPRHFFMFGLSAFLFAHIAYLMALKPFKCKSDKAKPFKNNQLKLVGFYCVYGVLMCLWLVPSLGKQLLPVLAYMMVLLMMAIATVLSEKSNFWLILGGLSFVISDSLLGINKFSIAIPNANFWVMTSYYLAQFSLVKGMLSYQKTIN